jgi:hypothetical protein
LLQLVKNRVTVFTDEHNIKRLNWISYDLARCKAKCRWITNIPSQQDPQWPIVVQDPSLKLNSVTPFSPKFRERIMPPAAERIPHVCRITDI